MMLLKELMQLTNVNISLNESAQNIEIHDDFLENPVTSITDTEITIKCNVEDISRIINFNFEKNTITELFASDMFHGGMIYSIDGKLLKIVN